MRIPDCLRSAFLLAAAVVCCATAACAQGTARSMNIDISARSAALGSASTALPWGDLNHWANPAVLGYAQGVRFVHGHTRLLPGLADDIFFNSDVVQVGGGGLGVVFSGKPFDAGGVVLDYGTSEATDPFGNPTGTFNAFERVRSLGAGASAAQLIESVMGIFGSSSNLRISRYADVSVGMTSKHTELVLAPASQQGTGKADSQDWGWLARVTPYDGLDTGEIAARLDVTYGRSDINYHLDELVTFGNGDPGVPVTRQHRRGVTVRGAAGRATDSVEPGTAQVLLRGLTPLVAFTWTEDHVDEGTLETIDEHTDGHGFELTLANLFSYRRGHYQDLIGGIDGDTWGWGVALPFGKLAGVAYDDAHTPQAVNSGLPPVRRQQFSAWMDVIAVWHATHAPSSPGTR